MTVNSFDPSDLGGPLDTSLADELCSLVEQLDDDEPVLDEKQAADYLALALHVGWQTYAHKLSVEVICGLVRLFTLSEMKYASWQAGDKSPVIALVKILKQREEFEPALNRWIKSHTDNKFLPHGSLKDLL
ncbi:MAG: hypothetical protein GXP16_05415 [Gammaproteobacteria bacterium]|nr:hypothetical protein [Gammaproteobacteria bacterium]